MNADTNHQVNRDRVPAVSSEEFRAICGLFPTGVTVVTRRLEDRRPYGMTVSSFSSVSLNPPLILICVDREAGFLERMTPGLPFIVNVLGEDQEHLAKRFSNRHEENRFIGIDWSPAWEDVPRLEGTVASFSCSLDTVVEAGDHFVLIGAVRKLERHRGRALVWCERGYHCLPSST